MDSVFFLDYPDFWLFLAFILSYFKLKCGMWVEQLQQEVELVEAAAIGWADIASERLKLLDEAEREIANLQQSLVQLGVSRQTIFVVESHS